MTTKIEPPKKKSRARKTSGVPTRIYSYRLLPPITNQALVESQFLLANQFRNALVEIEHRLWDRFRQIQLDDPDVRPALVVYEGACAAVDNAYDDLRGAKAGVVDPDLTVPKERLAAEKIARREAFADLKRAKKKAKKRLKPLYKEARARAFAEIKAARQDYSGRGLRHGAYSLVEKSVAQSTDTTTKPPMFQRYDGTGSIGTQLTETGAKTREAVDPDADGIGMTLPELLSGVDTRLRLGQPGESDKHPRAEVVGKKWSEVGALSRNVRRHAARTYVDLRVASDGRAPIFARFPVTLHRLPPKDAVIKWAYVVRKRIGHQYEWRFQLTLESPTFDRPPVAIGTGACAVNLGWRRIIDDQGEAVALRAAYVVDELGHEEEIHVPDYSRDRRRGSGRDPAPSRLDPATKISVLAAIGKCDDLAAIRDKTLERAQLALSQWLSDRGGVPESWTTAEAARPDGSVPKTMAEKLRGYSAWRAAWKLHRFVDQWQKRRIDGDAEIFASLCAWAKQDRHLETWQAHQRETVIARRREEWRLVATKLARKYATIVVGESKLTDIDGWEQKDPENGDPSEGREQRRMSRICAPGELRAEIEKAVAKTGARVIRHAEKHATRDCFYCGHDEPWDAAPRVDHTCSGCGRTWDQDANYCRNLLKRSGFEPSAEGRQEDNASGGVQAPGGKALAASKPARSRGSAGSDAAMQMSPMRS